MRSPIQLSRACGQRSAASPELTGPCGCARPGSDRERGIALVLVLWVIALLTLMALGLTATQRTETALTRNQVDAVRFRALADAALHYAVLNLQVPPPVEGRDRAEVWIPDGSPLRWRFGGETLEIRVFNEASRIDLNAVQSDLLQALLAVLGVEPEAAASLTNRILDWRDEDDLRLVDGAEDGDYEAAGLPYGAKDRPFDSVEELQQVLGMTRALYRELAPALSTDAGSEQVDEELATPLVLAALRGIALEEAEEEVRLRHEPVVPGAEPAEAGIRGGPLYRVRVTWIVGRRRTQTMEALIASNPGSDPPFTIGWRRFGLAAGPVVRPDPR